MTLNANDARLLTPGPLTTSQETKEVMLHDWGSRDSDFIEIIIIQDLLHIFWGIAISGNPMKLH